MHFEKYHKNQLTKLLQHYTREHITENVDRERMKENVYCCNQILESWAKENNKKIDSDLISSYVGDNIGSRQKRKFREDQVVMIDLIITQPTELGTTYNKDFFNKCISVLNSDYVSKNNFLYYSIHNDEKGQPHLHYSFMPFMKDKKGNEKLCAKEFLTKDFLKSFHQEMEKKTGYKLTSEDKTIKNLSMQQYQNKKDMERLKNEIAEQKEKIKQLENEKEKNQDTISNYTKKVIDKAVSVKIENDTARFKDCEIKEIELKTIPPIPKKKNILGEIIDTEKINDWINDTNETIKKIFSNYAFNLANIKIKDTIINKKAQEIFDIQEENNILKTNNIKISTELNVTKEKANKYDMLRAQYNSLANQWNDREQALDNMDLLDKVNNQVKMMHQSKQHGLSL